MYAASLDSIDLVEQIVKEEGIECNFSRCGHLEVACKQSHFDGFAESAAEIKREFNHDLRIVPKSELDAEIGSNIYYGGMVDETSGGLNPAQFRGRIGQSRAVRRSFALRPCASDCASIRFGREARGCFWWKTSRGRISAQGSDPGERRATRRKRRQRCAKK